MCRTVEYRYSISGGAGYVNFKPPDDIRPELDEEVIIKMKMRLLIGQISSSHINPTNYSRLLISLISQLDLRENKLFNIIVIVLHNILDFLQCLYLYSVYIFKTRNIKSNEI